MGTGNEGTFLACALRSGPNPPPVTFLIREERRIKHFEQSGRKITLVLPDGMEHVADGMQIELYAKRSTGLGPEVLSTFSSRPIFNLITTIRSRHVADTLGEAKHRLSKESTVLVSSYGIGVKNKIFKTHYQDPTSRPTFCRVISGQPFWELAESLQGHKDDLASMMKQKRSRQPGFRVALEAIGQRLGIEPLILKDGAGGGESSQAVEERKVQARYLITTLLSAPFLGANEIDYRLVLFVSFKKMASASVVGPLAVMMEYSNGELFADAAAREIDASLIFEVWGVIRRHLPTLQLHQVSSWIAKKTAKTSTQLHSMLLDAISGKETDIDDINGWIIDQAYHYGVPCDLHEGMRDLVKTKALEIRKEIEATEAAKRTEIKFRRDAHRSPDPDRVAEPLDKLEVKRMKKAEKQREKLGH
ncbi:hypothetical protein N431DRAFT_472434 [Stipitochalara longipes BDJ]|nr:hypothetical protein N431DRAFT_472434 [Stipitochalara longipes BDJ]